MMRFLRIVLLSLWSSQTALAADLPSPPPPADFSLVKWAEVVDYFRKADAASDRVVVRELGRTTEGRPYLAAFVSSAETIRDLDRYRAMQRRIAQVEDADDPKLVPESKPVVLVTCSIHSTETASNFMAMRLLHDLAAGDDPATKEILDRTILILVPSANPDGVDIVADWYAQTKGKPWEGDGLPRLYHKYAGHDTNRDWFMLNLEETQILTHLLYEEWFPTLAYDVHQMGSRGARLFVPPFFDPINPNLDPRLHQSIATIGAHMALDLSAAGKKGVLSSALYDNWWNGGNRTTPQRHNIVAVLTEAASVKMASPIFLDKEELRAGSRGMSDHRPAVNFVDPWPGGWWRLADIEQYEYLCARSLLTLAARYKDRFQSDYLAMGRAAIDKGRHEPPFGWAVPLDGHDPGTAAEMVRILHATGIRVDRTKGEWKAEGVAYPAGTFVLRADQPYRAHLKDMMERQDYPPRFAADGSAEPPYDVAGWTLPLQMGVRAVRLDSPVPTEGLEAAPRVEAPEGGIDDAGPDTASYRIANRANDDFRVLNALLADGVEVLHDPGGGLVFAKSEKAKRVLKKILSETSTRVQASLIPAHDVAGNEPRRVRARRIGVYQPWVPSMDEGWTRLVLERFDFPYQTLHNADIRAGSLKARIDALVIPSIDAKTLREGYAPNESAPEFTGGLGPEGVEALRAFVREGGTLICLESSCEFAIKELGLGVTDVVKGLKTSEFYGPGSILRVVYERPGPSEPLSVGMPEEGSVYFDRSLAFDLARPSVPAVQVVARYAETGLLQSGWLQGGARIAGKAALLDVPFGHGHVILFGFPPQHRGQPHGTFRLLFNALYR